VPTYRGQTNETSALGAAIAGYVGLGRYKSFDEAVKNMVQTGRIFYPDMKKHEILFVILTGYTRESGRRQQNYTENLENLLLTIE